MLDLPEAATTADGRLRTPFRLLTAGVCVLSALTLVAAVASLFGVDPTPDAIVGTAALVGLIATGGVVVPTVVALARYVDRRRVADLGIGSAWCWREFAAGMVIGCVSVGGVYGIGVWIGVFRPTGLAAPDPVALGLLVGAMVAVSVYEELLFRGYLLRNVAEGATAFVSERAAVLWSLLLSSLLFGILHAGNPHAPAMSLLVISLVGVALGVGYAATGGLGVPTGIHLTWNVSGFLLGLPVSGLGVETTVVSTQTDGSTLLHGGGFGLEGGVLGVVAAGICCAAVGGYVYADRNNLTAVTRPTLRSRGPADGSVECTADSDEPVSK
ncbi:MAG: type II CAAX endopeptidase family protein [Natronomonas sp.]